MSQAPWSVKGIDPKARSVARERAQRQGVTLGQFLNSLLLEGDEGEFQDVDLGEPLPRASADGDLRRMSVEIDQLSQRLEASTGRAARSIAGVDKSILGLMGKVDASGKAQLHALERVTRAMGEIETTQTALRTRIDSLEAENRNGATLDGLKALESSLARLSDTLQQRLADSEAEQHQLRTLFDEKVNQVSSKVDDVARSVDEAVSNAVRTNSAGVTGRMDQIEEKISSAERRIEAGIAKITDAASRFELFETKAERAVGDTTWRMERALESNLTRSRAMSKEVLDRVDAIEEKTREAMNSLGEAVARITDRVNRTERKTDNAVGVLERAVSEIDERTARGGPSSDDLNQLQQVFQKRIDSIAEEVSRPMQTMRADMERRIDDAVRSGSPEKVERLERTILDLQKQIQVSEARQADAIEAMSSQVDRLSRAVDDRLRAVESRNDSKSIDDVRREIANLADTIDARLGTERRADRSTPPLMTSSPRSKSAAQAPSTLSANRSPSWPSACSAATTRAFSASATASPKPRRPRARSTTPRSIASPTASTSASRKANTAARKPSARSANRSPAPSNACNRTLKLAARLRGSPHRQRPLLRNQAHRRARRSAAPDGRVVRADHRRAQPGPEHCLVAGPPPADARRRAPRSARTGSLARHPDRSGRLRHSRRRSASKTRTCRSSRPSWPPSTAPTRVLETDDIVGVEPPPFDRPDPRDAHLFDDAQPAIAAATAGPGGEPAHSIEDLLEADDDLFGAAGPACRRLRRRPAGRRWPRAPLARLSRRSPPRRASGPSRRH